MTQEELIRAAWVALESDERVLAAWVGGSFGNGTADEYSDVDLIAALEEKHLEKLRRDASELIDAIAPTVHQFQQVFGRVIVRSGITPDWLRFDLTLSPPERLLRRPRSGLRLLFDREGIHERLPEVGVPQRPDPVRVAYLTREFLRCLGLAPVALGREEYSVGVTGVGLLRGLLVDLIREELEVEDRGGALKLNSLLPEPVWRELEELPPLRADRESVVESQVALTRLFLPRARRLHQKLGIDWPEDFERATRAYLLRELELSL